ncbi:MurR/RpiR family transcriptional regulator [Oscillospiraceae bacterium OttesenSCG-928-F05]|nr:MurR/RpiR family transcriptional regulator [Oscillospiraceae bacterium OttesenSCG-928-F05]
MNTIHRLLASYNTMPPDDTYHQALGKILQNMDRMHRSTIYEVAEMCSVSVATIVRLAQKLGYENFTDFRQEICAANNQFRHLNRILPPSMCQTDEGIAANYVETIRSLINNLEAMIDMAYANAIADALHAAEKIRFFSFGKYYAEVPLQINLLKSGKDAKIIAPLNEQIRESKRLDEKSMIVVFCSESIDNIDIDEIFEAAKRAGAKILVIANARESSYEAYADFIIANGFSGVNTMLSSYVAQMYLDIITTVYRKKYIDAR